MFVAGVVDRGIGPVVVVVVVGAVKGYMGPLVASAMVVVVVAAVVVG